MAMKDELLRLLDSAARKIEAERFELLKMEREYRRLAKTAKRRGIEIPLSTTVLASVDV